jgi:hypothetical protein
LWPSIGSGLDTDASFRQSLEGLIGVRWADALANAAAVTKFRADYGALVAIDSDSSKRAGIDAPAASVQFEIGYTYIRSDYRQPEPLGQRIERFERSGWTGVDTSVAEIAIT